MIYNLERFVQAQENTFDTASEEIRNGCKVSHWMWFIFPQHKNLGFSKMAHYYGLSDLNEAKAYLEHPILGQRLRAVCGELLNNRDKTAEDIFGFVDALKLKSSMTLFNLVSPDDIFLEVLNVFYEGKLDNKTVQLLGTIQTNR